MDRYKLKLFIVSLYFVAVMSSGSMGLLILALAGEMRFTAQTSFLLATGWGATIMMCWYTARMLCTSMEEHIAGAARSARKIREFEKNSCNKPRT